MTTTPSIHTAPASSPSKSPLPQSAAMAVSMPSDRLPPRYRLLHALSPSLRGL